jgi:hypothetical protein
MCVAFNHASESIETFKLIFQRRANVVGRRLAVDAAEECSAVAKTGQNLVTYPPTFVFPRYTPLHVPRPQHENASGAISECLNLRLPLLATAESMDKMR